MNQVKKQERVFVNVTRATSGHAWVASFGGVTINDCVRPQKSFPFCLDRREIKKSASADGDKERNGETRRNLNANVVSRSE